LKLVLLQPLFEIHLLPISQKCRIQRLGLKCTVNLIVA
jgi:hypothetical protein